MKWKLTARFLLSVLSIVIIVIFVNTAIFMGLLTYRLATDSEGVSATEEEHFVREFQKYIEIKNGATSIRAEGIEQLISL